MYCNLIYIYIYILNTIQLADTNEPPQEVMDLNVL